LRYCILSLEAHHDGGMQTAQPSHPKSRQLIILQNTATEPYRDSPARTRNTSSTHHASPSSSDSSATIKPLPATPPPYADEEPYRDDPSPPSEATPPTRQTSSSTHDRQSRCSLRYQPYTDSPPQTPDADDVPLAHLLSTHTYTQSTQVSHQPNDALYPADAPPPYAIAVRQSYRDTLIQYIPRGQHASPDADEESQVGVDLLRPDDVRYSIEKIVAMFVVALLLLVVSGVLAWLALGSGVMG
jgi:hypothetical protein